MEVNQAHGDFTVGDNGRVSAEDREDAVAETILEVALEVVHYPALSQ